MVKNETKEETILNEMERKVLGCMALYNRPVTVREISFELNLPLKKVAAVFKSLQKKGNIVIYSSEKGERDFYALTTSKAGMESALSQMYADIAGALEKQYESIKTENEHLQQQIDKIYANILTLMGIFVAIFALIVININGIGLFVEKTTTFDELFWALLKLNVPLILAIGILVALIKWFLHSKKRK